MLSGIGALWSYRLGGNSATPFKVSDKGTLVITSVALRPMEDKTLIRTSFSIAYKDDVGEAKSATVCSVVNQRLEQSSTYVVLPAGTEVSFIVFGPGALDLLGHIVPLQNPQEDEDGESEAADAAEGAPSEASGYVTRGSSVKRGKLPEAADIKAAELEEMLKMQKQARK